MGTTKWLKDIRALIEAEGATVDGIDPLGNGHFKIRVSSDAVRGILTVSGSPGDWRVLNNIRRDVRQLLRRTP